jgi:hypothetical protein
MDAKTKVSMVVAHCTVCEIWDGELSDSYYYSHASLCVLDAVYSLRLNYTKIVVPLIEKYAAAYQVHPKSDRNHRATEREDTLEDLVSRLSGPSQLEFLSAVGRGSKDFRQNGVEKSAIVFELANALLAEGVNTLADLSDWAARTDLDRFKKQTPAIKGFGQAGLYYLAMLAGRDDLIKPDTMIHRFVSRALGMGSKKLENDEVVLILQTGAGLLGVAPREMDHSIWKYESERARTGTFKGNSNPYEAEISVFSQ